MLAMTFSADKKIRMVTKSRGGHPLNNSNQINSSEFWPIKGGICHAFRHLGFQIKIHAYWVWINLFKEPIHDSFFIKYVQKFII